MGEACTFCSSTATGPDAQTPHGICVECACPRCRGFARFDDRGFLCTGQPFLEATDCTACGGEGTRTAAQRSLEAPREDTPCPWASANGLPCILRADHDGKHSHERGFGQETSESRVMTGSANRDNAVNLGAPSRPAEAPQEPDIFLSAESYECDLSNCESIATAEMPDGQLLCEEHRVSGDGIARDLEHAQLYRRVRHWRSNEQDDRCAAQDGQGLRCTFPEAHASPHSWECCIECGAYSGHSVECSASPSSNKGSATHREKGKGR